MKIFLVILSGFVMTLATYAGGVATAIFFLNAEPVPVRAPTADTDEVWTSEPVTVEAAAQDFQRVPARPVPERASDVAQAEVEPETTEGAGSENLVDPTTTAAIASDPLPEAEAEPEPEPEPAAPTLNPAHVEWCSERYRSYRPGDNSYTPYSGGKRECVSPFTDGNGSSISTEEAYVEEEESYAEASSDQPFVGYAVEDEEPGGYLTPEHVESCFARYRSYRPEDNSYQPYGGGPRRQCR